MANRFTRPTVSRARQRAIKRRRLMIGGGALAALLVVGLAILLIPKGGRTDRAVEALAQATPTPAPEAQAEAGANAENPLADTPQPTQAPTPEPTPEQVSLRALTRPTPTAEGFMPVFS